MKKLLAILLALSLVCMLFACNPENVEDPTDPPVGSENSPNSEKDPEPADDLYKELSGPVEIDFWHCISNATHLEILEGLVADFNSGIGAEYGITVNAYAQGSQYDLDNAVVGAIKANSVPDVTLSTLGYVANYLLADCVVDMTDYINDPDIGLTDKDDFYENFMSQGSSYNAEGTYSLPIHMKAEVLYYNINFFEEHNLEVPTTWDELIAVSRQIHDITGTPAFGWDSLASLLVSPVLQLGGEYTDKEGNILLYNYEDEMAQVMEMWKSCIDEGIWRLAGEDGFFSGPFANEIVPMYVGVSTESSWINVKAVDGLRWGAAPIPTFEGSPAYTYQEGHVISILSQDKDPDKILAGWIFAKYMTSYEANLATACGSGYMPIRKSVAESEDYLNFCEETSNYASYIAAQEADNYYFGNGFVAETYTSAGLWEGIKTMMDNYLSNDVPMEDAIAQLKAEFNG